MTDSLTNSSTRWFGTRVTPADTSALLFCLPFAGGAARVFHSWRSAAPAGIDVQPIHLPGRESRHGEPAQVVPAALAEALIGRADRPYGIYGHSMGARVGFEVIRELRRRGAPLPRGFYVGAAHPPEVAEPVAQLSYLSDDDFVRRLEELGGTPPGVLAVPELREILLPVVRADLTWLDVYRYQAEPPLPVPVVAFAGRTDPVVSPEAMQGWGGHTSAGFRLHTVPGDHFFLQEQAERLLQLIGVDLLREARA